MVGRVEGGARRVQSEMNTAGGRRREEWSEQGASLLLGGQRPGCLHALIWRATRRIMQSHASAAPVLVMLQAVCRRRRSDDDMHAKLLGIPSYW